MDDAIQGSKMPALQDRGVGAPVSALEPTGLNSSSGFPGGSVVRNPPVNAGAAGDMGLIPGVGRCPGGGNGNPLHYACPENPTGRVACEPQPGGRGGGVTESAGTSPLSTGSHPPSPLPDVSAAPPAGEGPDDWARKGLRKLGLARGFQEGRQGHGQPAGRGWGLTGSA